MQVAIRFGWEPRGYGGVGAFFEIRGDNIADEIVMFVFASLCHCPWKIEGDLDLGKFKFGKIFCRVIGRKRMAQMN